MIALNQEVRGTAPMGGAEEAAPPAALETVTRGVKTPSAATVQPVVEETPQEEEEESSSDKEGESSEEGESEEKGVCE